MHGRTPNELKRALAFSFVLYNDDDGDDGSDGDGDDDVYAL